MAARKSQSAVVRQLAPTAWCPLQCLLAKTVGVLSPGVGRSEECAQEFAPQITNTRYRAVPQERNLKQLSFFFFLFTASGA